MVDTKLKLDIIHIGKMTIGDNLHTYNDLIEFLNKSNRLDALNKICFVDDAQSKMPDMDVDPALTKFGLISGDFLILSMKDDPSVGDLRLV